MELLRHGLDVSDHGHGCANGHANGFAGANGSANVRFCANLVCADGTNHDGANYSFAHDEANCCSCANCTIDLWDGLRPHSVAYHRSQPVFYPNGCTACPC